MADDRAQPPKPRPRRRRTDIDPTAPTPPVANERRRRRKASPPTPAPEPTPPTTAGARHPAPDRPIDSNAPFHVPGLIGVDTAATPGGGSLVVGNQVSEAATEDRHSWLQRLDDRSPDPRICPFLRAIDDTGLGKPIERPNTVNRCAALSEAVPQSLRQQELVCLSAAHVNCPRYLRGAVIATETPAPVVRSARTTSPAMLGSLVVLVLAMTASVAFVLARGGALSIGLPEPVPSASASIVAVVSPSPVASPSPIASVAASASASPSLSPSPLPTATPSSPDPTARATARPTPTSDRYQLLRACPDAPRCWIYRVRSGDNLYSIARYFGVSRDSIYARNPWVRSQGLRAGQELRLPPPTR